MPTAQELSDQMSVGLWMSQHKGVPGTTPYDRYIPGLPPPGYIWTGDHWESPPSGPPTVPGGGFQQALHDAPVGISLAGLGQLQGWTKAGEPVFNGQIYPWSSVKQVDPGEIEQATKRWEDQVKFHAEHPELYPPPAAPVAGKPELENISYSGDPNDPSSHHVDVSVSQKTPLGTWILNHGQLEGWEGNDPIISGKVVPLSEVNTQPSDFPSFNFPAKSQDAYDAYRYLQAKLLPYGISVSSAAQQAVNVLRQKIADETGKAPMTVLPKLQDVINYAIGLTQGKLPQSVTPATGYAEVEERQWATDVLNALGTDPTDPWRAELASTTTSAVPPGTKPYVTPKGVTTYKDWRATNPSAALESWPGLGQWQTAHPNIPVPGIASSTPGATQSSNISNAIQNLTNVSNQQLWGGAATLPKATSAPTPKSTAAFGTSNAIESLMNPKGFGGMDLWDFRKPILKR